jgi:hypothetical protein
MSMRVSATGVTVRGTNTGRGRGRTAAREAGGGDAMVANIESGAEGSAHCREVAGRRMRGYAYSRVDRGEEGRRGRRGRQRSRKRAAARSGARRVRSAKRGGCIQKRHTDKKRQGEGIESTGEGEVNGRARGASMASSHASTKTRDAASTKTRDAASTKTRHAASTKTRDAASTKTRDAASTKTRDAASWMGAAMTLPAMDGTHRRQHRVLRVTASASTSASTSAASAEHRRRPTAA